MPFDLAGVTRRIAEILSAIMDRGFPTPGVPGLYIPLWLILLVAAAVIFIVTNLVHKR